MQYDEKKALAIIEKFQLQPTTLRVWKNRQSIPDKYADENFQVRKQLTNEQQLQAMADIFNALKTQKFNYKSLARLSGLPEFIVNDFMQQRQRLSEQELNALRKGINIIRNELKAILPELNKPVIPEKTVKQLHHFINRPEIKFYVFMMEQKQAYDSFYSWAAKKNQTAPHTGYIEIFKTNALIFLTETAIN